MILLIKIVYKFKNITPVITSIFALCYFNFADRPISTKQWTGRVLVGIEMRFSTKQPRYIGQSRLVLPVEVAKIVTTTKETTI